MRALVAGGDGVEMKCRFGGCWNEAVVAVEIIRRDDRKAIRLDCCLTCQRQIEGDRQPVADVLAQAAGNALRRGIARHEAGACPINRAEREPASMSASLAEVWTPSELESMRLRLSILFQDKPLLTWWEEEWFEVYEASQRWGDAWEHAAGAWEIPESCRWSAFHRTADV